MKAIANSDGMMKSKRRAKSFIAEERWCDGFLDRDYGSTFQDARATPNRVVSRKNVVPSDIGGADG